MIMLRGDTVSNAQMGQIVDRAVAAANAEQARSFAPSTSAINLLQQFLVETVEMDARRRPTNLYSAEAARQAHKGEGEPKGKHRGFTDPLNLSQSGARYQEMIDSGRYSGLSVSAGGGDTPLKTSADFVRSYAGSGVGAEVLRTFATVGLDRGTFDQFRHEGYSAAQIADNARDMKALNFHGKDDAAVSMHASNSLRKAVVAQELHDTPENRAKEAAERARSDALPDGDPQKTRDRGFMKRALEKSRDADRHRALGTGAEQHDVSGVHAEAVAASARMKRAENQNLASGKTQSVASIENKVANAFDLEVDPIPAKPQPTKTNVAKLPAGPKPA